MHNLRTVILFEFLRIIKKRSFWLGTLAFPAIISIVFVLSYFSGQTASKVSKENAKEQFSIALLDQSGLISGEAKEAIKARVVSSKEVGIQLVKENKSDAFFYYPANPATSPIEVYGKDAGLMKNDKYSAVAEGLLTADAARNVHSPELVSIIQGNIHTEVTTYKNGVVEPGFERVIAPGIFLIVLYLIVVLLGPQMLASTTEEKENRVIEMILTSVRAKTLIIGKIIGLFLVGILQICIILLPTVIAFVFFKDSLHLPAIDLASLPIPPLQMILAAIIFVCALMLFTGLLVAIGASMPTAKEANSFFGIVIGGMFVPLYGVTAIISSPEQVLVQVFTFFPLTAPITLLVRNAIGNLSLAAALVGIAVLIISSVVALWAAIRAFQYGTLEYSRKLSFKDLFRK